MFSQVSVCPRGGVYPSMQWGRHPPDQRQTAPLGRPPGPEADSPPLGRPPCPVHAGIHPPPAQCMLGYSQQAGGTDPAGMHSCF